MFLRSRNPFFAVSQSYHVRKTSKIQVNFRFYRCMLDGTDDWVLWIFEISLLPTFSRSRNPFFVVSQSYYVWVNSKIQINFRFYRYSRVLMIGSHGFSKFLHSIRFRGQGIHFSQFHKATMFGKPRKSRSTSGFTGARGY